MVGAWRWWLLTALLILGGRIWAGVQLAGAERALVCDLLGVAKTLFAVVGLAWAAHVGHRAWRWLAAGTTCWLIADVLWLVMSLLGKQPWASWIDIFFLLFYPLLLIGVLHLPARAPTPRLLLSGILDLAIVLCGGLAVLWSLVIGPNLALGAQSGLSIELLIAIGYPLGDLLLVWAVMDVVLRRRSTGSRLATWLMAASAVPLMVADVVYGVQLLNGTYASGNWLGILWSAGLLMLGLAGARAAAVPAADSHASGTYRMGAARWTFACLIVVWLITWLRPQQHALVPELALGGMLVLALVRQSVALAENRRLARSLRDANHDLERRVADRTNELEQAHGRLRTAEKMEAIGRLSGGIAHDFNNLLTAIIGHVEIARGKIAGQPGADNLIQAAKAADRAAALTKQLLAFGRRSVQRPRPVDVPTVVHEVVGLLGRLLPEVIRLEVQVVGVPAPVLVDPSQLHQVLMNLAINARDAMPQGGRLQITVSEELIGQGRAHPDARVGRHVCLLVSDTGHGMDDATRARLFEPFFTTKEIGLGNGLGLASVHGIVRQSGGWIEVDSTPGAGSRFSVFLPCTERSPSSSSLPPISSHMGTGQVLLVEDDAVVREVVQAHLERLGYAVTVADAPVAALALLAQGGFRALVSDVVMPEMSGPDLVRRARQQHPGLAVVLMTGYDGGAVAQIDDCEILTKPFTSDQLAASMARALGAVRGRQPAIG